MTHIQLNRPSRTLRISSLSAQSEKQKFVINCILVKLNKHKTLLVLVLETFFACFDFIERRLSLNTESKIEFEVPEIIFYLKKFLIRIEQNKALFFKKRH